MTNRHTPHSTSVVDELVRRVRIFGDIQSTQPRYLRIVDAIQQAIKERQLSPGDRLPTHRNFAQRVGIAVATVSRAYAEAERRGLVRGRMGSGTFVVGMERAFSLDLSNSPAEAIDLTVNRLSWAEANSEFSKTLEHLSKRQRAVDLFGYQPATGQAEHRVAAAAWIGRTGLSVNPEAVVLCNGAQHALAVLFGALANPGDVVLTEELNYPGIRLLEKLYKLRLQGVEIDEWGIVPAALERACAHTEAKFLLCTPSIHNPTCSTMPLFRRKQIVQIAERHSLVIVEDDIYGLLPTDPVLPLAALAPTQTYYVTSASKTIGSGVRVGYIVSPHRSSEALIAAVQGTTWMPSPLMAEAMFTWINEGVALRALEWHRQEANARQGIAKQILGEFKLDAHPLGYNLWLHVPEPWRETEFVAQAARRKVLVSPSESFMIGRGGAPHAVRVCLAGVGDRHRLELGLTTIRKLLLEGPRPERVVG